MMLYNSTRDKNITLSPSQAILKGLSDDGGLFVPEKIPVMDRKIDELKELTYRELAYEVMKLWFDDFTEEELKKCIDSAYDDKFDTPEIAPLAYSGGAYYLELYHGKTIAFKDMALSILPYLMTTSARKNNVEDEIVILTATSGDTGKAALAGFANVKGTRIIVFYPKDGVSPIQKLQMVTQEGDNTLVVGVDGNFDDCQTGVKRIFNDEDFKAEILKKGYRLSSANSINIGRLVPQIVYYFYAYLKLLKNEKLVTGDKINVCVPTGNFGNILAAYYAKNMGLPIDKLICASNDNKVLFDFFNSGVYDRNREFILTASPSMDILISSNLERLLYHIAGNDPEKTAKLMKDLSEGGKYEITDDMKKNLESFMAGYASQEETFKEIKRVFTDTGYVLDTHTAVASSVVCALKGKHQELFNKPVVIASTASPFKFAKSVMYAINGREDEKDDFYYVDELASKGNLVIPEAVNGIRNAAVRHRMTIAADEMKKAVTDFLK